jgi:DNA-binding TFAR19-related protein (PDSD5 family)
MTGTPQQSHHLEKAQEADALAQSIADPTARESWKRIAVAYRDLAQMQAIRSGRLFR